MVRKNKINAKTGQKQKTSSKKGDKTVKSARMAKKSLSAKKRGKTAIVAVAKADVNHKNGEYNPASQQQNGNGEQLYKEDINEKVKELIRLAKEQGYLTYSDINEALPEKLLSPDEYDEILTKLRSFDIDIVDQAEVDQIKQIEPLDDEDKEHLDILDDPVRMYLKQMGQVPLLTREQEVEISKRIEEAENRVKKIIYSFGFTAKEHIALAEKLISEPPKERFDRVIVDKKVESRDEHIRDLR
ncbi:MAG: RNA polymerase sigma factor region1.1 domain-containing protein, partial [Verrucomicrobiia bacterium]